MTSSNAPLRSLLFAPGNHARRVEKALTLDADAVILDLEDAVAASEKPAARDAVLAAVAAAGKPGPLIYIRINAADTIWHDDDLAAVIVPGLDGVVLPKAETAEVLLAVDARMTELEAAAGFTPGTLDLLPIIETGLGLANVRAMAAANTRVRRLSFGAADFAADMGMRWTADEAEMTPARAEVALASRAGNLEAPVDTVWTRLKDADGLVRSAARVRDLGFQGKLCIHPDQIAPVNEAFTPTADETAFAEKVVQAFNEAEAAGSASIAVDGQFVDYPIVEKARRTLAFMDRLRTAKDPE